ncbi:hypothetical protein OKA04_07465 [Luteolibacter flavescens]|uniref:Uncharacterized protein n=1 Tax=Luteolibacter flavescens TaxID=1859460 RepID=A0ABT3FLW7_9BACT|nr:hypothetical protein [Luteolibacter flavescens]MCW1884566.1 hypothetical protein [Luteolibacter flavescens]
MTLEQRIAQAARAVLCSGPVPELVPVLAARRPATASLETQPHARHRLILESGGLPVVPPSARRELWI